MTRQVTECTEPELVVDFTSDLTPDKRAKLVTLFGALKVGLPKLLRISAYASQAFVRSIQEYKAALDGLVGAVASSGATAVECVAGAVGATGRAIGQVEVSVSVSVMVSASASATVN